MSSDEQAYNEIKKIAHELWEQEGRPHGKDRQHWEAAKEIWAVKQSQNDAQLTADNAASQGKSPLHRKEDKPEVG